MKARLEGSTKVTITGANLLGATAVKFGSAAAKSFTVVSGTSITAESPAGAAGTVNVVVTTVGGESALSGADDFTYVAAPTVTKVEPAEGPAAGGTKVTITGTHFTGAKEVKFGSVAAKSLTVVSGTSITAESPAGAAGTVNVTVTTVGGKSAVSSADDFTYVAAPTVTKVEPAEGPVAGGTNSDDHRHQLYGRQRSQIWVCRGDGRHGEHRDVDHRASPSRVGHRRCDGGHGRWDVGHRQRRPVRLRPCTDCHEGGTGRRSDRRVGRR